MKKSIIEEITVDKYYLKHWVKPTKRKYHIGIQRLHKLIRNQEKNIIKKETTVKINDYIVELASSRRLALAIPVIFW